MDIEKYFFFIDSANVQTVENQLYGYCISPIPTGSGRQSVDFSDPDLWRKSNDGSYVIVQSLGGHVIISQDAVGSYGLYLYQEGGYFAVSNSFLLLLERLAHAGRKLTLDKAYADLLLLGDFSMNCCLHTSVCEIKELMRNTALRIDKSGLNVDILEKELAERQTDIDSEAGMALVDAWHGKWTAIIADLAVEQRHICVDLSGGFDSRLVFTLFMSSGVDLRKFTVANIKDKLHTHAEDTQIARQMASRFGFELNRFPDLKHKYYTLDDSLQISFYTKLGFHRQMYFQSECLEEPLLRFTGMGGETIRHYRAGTEKEIYKRFAKSQNDMPFNYDLFDASQTVLSDSFSAVRKLHPLLDESDMGTVFYNECANRHHHGKEMVERAFSNQLRVAPALDADLQKLRYPHGQEYLLNTVIMMRFCPELLEFPFDSGRKIPEETLATAKAINDRHPRSQDSRLSCSYTLVAAGQSSHDFAERPFPFQELDKLCQRVYRSDFVKKPMLQMYPKEVYDYAQTYHDRHSYFPGEEMYANIALAYVRSCLKTGGKADIFQVYRQSQTGLEKSEAELPDLETTVEKDRRAGKSARVDLRNLGHGNRLEITRTDPSETFFMNTPRWLQDEAGIGYVLTDDMGAMHARLKCRGSGKLAMWCRGIDFREAGKRVPLWVTLWSVKINGEELLQEPVDVWHDKVFYHEQQVADGEELDFYICWTPYGSLDEKALYEKNKAVLSDYDNCLIDMQGLSYEDAVPRDKASRIEAFLSQIDSDKPIVIDDQYDSEDTVWMCDKLRGSDLYGTDNKLYLRYSSLKEFNYLLRRIDWESVAKLRKAVFVLADDFQRLVHLTSGDGSAARPLQLEELNELIHTEVCGRNHGYSGSDFFNMVLDSHPNMLTIGWQGLPTFPVLYLVFLKGKTSAAAIVHMQNPANEQEATLLDVNLGNMLKYKYEQRLAGFYGSLSGLLDSDKEYSMVDWFRAFYLAANAAVGRKFTSRMIPAIFYDWHAGFDVDGYVKESIQKAFGYTIQETYAMRHKMYECFKHQKVIGVIRNPMSRFGCSYTSLIPSGEGTNWYKNPMYGLRWWSEDYGNEYPRLSGRLRRITRVVRFEDLKLYPKETTQ